MNGGTESRSSGTDSGEEDGDAQWKAAIDSVATDFVVSVANANHSTKSFADSNRTTEEEKQKKHQKLKLYQIKAQKLLEDLVDKSLEMVRNPIPNLDNDPPVNEGRIRLFRKAPPGITFDPIEFQGPKKRPRILPGEEFDEKSKKCRSEIQSVAVDGTTIMAAARDACQKSLARFEAKDAAAMTVAKREEERVAELKRIRGEKWLLSIAREMKILGLHHKAV